MGMARTKTRDFFNSIDLSFFAGSGRLGREPLVIT